jgi:hypothetical protein
LQLRTCCSDRHLALGVEVAVGLANDVFQALNDRRRVFGLRSLHQRAACIAPYALLPQVSVELLEQRTTFISLLEYQDHVGGAHLEYLAIAGSLERPSAQNQQLTPPSPVILS